MVGILHLLRETSGIATQDNSKELHKKEAFPDLDKVNYVRPLKVTKVERF
jgi:hypothetical protein